MTTSVIIRSPSPNNALVVVLAQTIDPDGNPVGDPVVVTELDDGQETHQHVWANRVLVIAEQPRNATITISTSTSAASTAATQALLDAMESQGVLADDASAPALPAAAEGGVVHVIGGTVPMPPAPETGEAA